MLSGPREATKSARVLSEKTEREVFAPRPHLRRGTCCEAVCNPPAGGRALAFCAGSQVRPMDGRFFFAGRFHEPFESNCVSFNPDLEAKHGASAGRRGVK